MGYRTRLIPIFSDVIEPDAGMAALIDDQRAPFKADLEEVIGTTESLLYRRGNFNGTWDDLICDAIRTERDTQIALSPGVRWGPTLLPGDPITREDILNVTSMTYGQCYRTEMSGAQLKLILEDVADNIFNPDPYYQQGGDMVRTGGLSYAIDVSAQIGSRIEQPAPDRQRRGDRPREVLHGRRVGQRERGHRGAADLGRDRGTCEEAGHRDAAAIRDRDRHRHLTEGDTMSDNDAGRDPSRRGFLGAVAAGGAALAAGRASAAGPDPLITDAILAAHGLSTDGPLIAPCNVTLLRDGVNTVLFDVGAGPDFQSTAGRLADALGVAGVAPDTVTHVLFTHGHPDHLWGLLDDFDEPMFPAARYMIGGTEFDYWTDPATTRTIDPSRTTFAVGAKRRLDILADIVARLEDGDAPVDGVRARLTPGHTPGHMSFDLGGLLVTGDCIGNGHVSFDRPDTLLGSDQNPERAAETRMQLMPELAASRLPILGFHLSNGGIGHVDSLATGFGFTQP